MTGLDRRLLYFGTDLIQGNDSVALEHCVKLIGRQATDVIDGSRRPANLDAVDFRSRAETKVQAEIVLRKITASAMNLVGLRHSTRDNFRTSVESEAIAFCSGELETDPMASRNTIIFQ